ncbi:MAG: AAA family ATPase [Chloroflexi bacterium]|nr:AAA family ATPase [Chloroflexota bacterium]
MICSNCNTTNREQANVCKQCGAVLAHTCPRCNVALPDAAIFCDHCGLRLVDSVGAYWQTAPSALPRVEIAPPPKPSVEPRAPIAIAPIPVLAESKLQQYIPEELRAKLDAARASGDMVGERKQVTVLFSDIVGSTALAEKLDPEEWGEIVSGAHRRVSEAIYRYEGTIAQLLGDGVLAFFGAPITHEDDPVRAVNAALDILKQIGEYRNELRAKNRVPDFQMRIGLNTGLVVVGNIGSDMHMEYLALGDAINLAARMEHTAAPGTVQIAHDTHKQVKSFFEFENLGGIEVKGKTEPVPAYRVLGRKESASRMRGIEGLHAEMVGRDAELITLRGVITDLKQGVGRIVCVLGEAGLGKTRLLHETFLVFKSLEGLNAQWHETLTLSYESNQAYGLIQRLIRRVNGIGAEDAPEAMRAKLGALVECLAEDRRARALQLFESLFGLESQNGNAPLDGEMFKRELCEAVRDWMRARFANQPTVLVFDDLHWCDAASVEMLRQLVALTEEIPLVVLCALRTERQAPAWQIKIIADEEYQHRYTEVALRPLSEAESNELLNRLLAVAELPDRLRANILEKSGGNPFFIEEVVRTLIDSGAVVSEDRVVNGTTRRYWRATNAGADFEIPDNLQSLLAARMDRLEESTRATLQIASVIGRSFYRRVLQLVDEASQDLDKHIGTLIRLDMIRESARVPELEYAFRNPLTQEAVYKTILLKRRRAFHRRVGQAMEMLFPNRLEGLAGLLAYHFAQAGERDKAITYARHAAQQAVAVYAYDDAIQNLRKALALIAPETAIELQLGLLEDLGDVYRLVRDFAQALALYQQALARARDGASDKIIAVRLHRKIVQIATDAKWSVDATAYQQVSEIRNESRAWLEENIVTNGNEPPHTETVQLLVALSMDAWRNQTPPDWDSAHRLAQRAVQMAEQLDDGVALSKALGALANVFDGRSLLREHLQVATRRLELCRAGNFDDARESIDALRGVGVALMYFGEYDQALPYLTEAETLAARIQATDQQVNAIGIQSHCLFRLDRWDEVLTTEARWRDLERRYTRERVGET